jgi:hypothetical protein
VSGVLVRFTAPESGSSGTFAATGTNVETKITSDGGVAAASTFTANEIPGGYVVTALATGAAGELGFDLINFVGYFVTPGGDDSHDCASPTHSCRTLRAAAARASSGDTVFVSEGTYTDSGSNVVSIGKDILLSGGWDPGFQFQGGLSVIDGENARTGISVGGEVTVERFVIRRGLTGVQNGRRLVLRECMVEDNSAGGIRNLGFLTVERSTIRRNRNNSGGGGIENSSGTLHLVNSTVTGNHASSEGGGIRLGDGLVTLNSSTIAFNAADFGGGGVSNRSKGTLVFRNTILSGNTARFGPDCFTFTTTAPFLSRGYNLVREPTLCAFTPGPGDLIYIDPRLLPLRSAGGPTPTHPIAHESRAVDAGNPDGCTDDDGNPLTTDQRRFYRPFARRCDIGAYEASSRSFWARLSGSQEVPRVATRATGAAQFLQDVMRSTLDFEVAVQGLKDVVGVQVHCGAVGLNGPVGMTLYSGAPVGSRTFRGRLKAPDPGNACGWVGIEDAVAAMANGLAYVNVPTLSNPGGRIRGQIRGSIRPGTAGSGR